MMQADIKEIKEDIKDIKRIVLKPIVIGDVGRDKDHTLVAKE
jgi:hypothetical protein